MLGLSVVVRPEDRTKGPRTDVGRLVERMDWQAEGPHPLAKGTDAPFGVRITIGGKVPIGAGSPLVESTMERPRSASSRGK